MSRIVVGGGNRLTVQQGRLGIGTDSLPPPAVWYDFSDISTLWQDSGRTTPVTTNGQAIGAVDDKTGNGQHLTQTAAVARPVYTTNAQNGLSVADTDATSNALYLQRLPASWVTIPRPYTIFTVARTPDTVSGSNTRALIYACDNNAGTLMLGLAPTVTNGGTWRYRTSSAGRDSVTYANFAAVGADTWYISTMIAQDAGDVTAYQNNVSDPISAGMAAQDYIRGCRLGHDRNLGGKDAGCWQGLIAEVRIYGFDADAVGNRSAIYSELASKWGL